MPDEIKVAQICRMMGWDYFTYRKQPMPFIELIWLSKLLELTQEQNAIRSRGNKRT